MDRKPNHNRTWQSGPKCFSALVVLVLYLGTLTVSMAQENRGSALYHLGEGAMAVMSQGKVKVPASRFPCVNCHGEDGMGGREGATLIPPISWKTLSTPMDNRPAYSIETFQNAIVQGVAANGQKLSELMPRYETGSQNLLALAKYLKTLDFKQREGITPNTIRIAPPENQDERLGFIEAITRFNKHGGSYGRTIVTEFEGQYFLAADDLVSKFYERLGSAIQKRILKSVVDDGVSVVALSNGPPDSALRHQLDLVHIQYDDVAPTMLILDGHSVNQSVLKKWFEQSERRKTDSNASSTSPRTLYAPASALGPYLETFATTPHKLILIDLDETAVRWAVSKRYSARSAAGFAMGKLLGESILSSGRDPTRYSIIKSMNEIDLQPGLFTWRSMD